MNYALGTFQGGPDPNRSRDEIVQALLARMGDPSANAELLNRGLINPMEDRGSYDPTGGSYDPASASPSFTDPGYSNVSVFGREGDDTSQASQDKQAADRAALAEAALGSRGYSETTPGFFGTPGSGQVFGRGDMFDPSSFEGASIDRTGKGDNLVAPNTNTVTTQSFTAPTTPTPTSSGLPSMVGLPSISDVFDAGKTMFGRGWDQVTAPIMTAPTAPPGAIPGGRTATPGAVPGAVPGGGVPGGGVPGGGAVGGVGLGSPSGGPGMSEPGGYSGGPGNTGGFGAGYSGSSEMGNTQGAQGFTTGGFSSGAAQGFSTGFNAGFEAGAAAAGMGTGGGAEGAGAGAGAGAGSSGGSDPGGSPGGVG